MEPPAVNDTARRPSIASLQALVRKMLGDRTPEEFMELQRDNCDTVYTHYLVTENVIDYKSKTKIGDKEDSSRGTENEQRLIQGYLLRLGSVVGDDISGRQMTREARRVYYSRNIFKVKTPFYVVRY
jgi:hypothetical protein